MSVISSDYMRYLARIAFDISELKCAGVISHFDRLLPFLCDDTHASAISNYLNNLRVINAALKLKDEIVPAAIKQPGKYFCRIQSHSTGRPQGVVNWPKTIRYRMGQELLTQDQFLCNASLRSSGAPENLLLKITLHEVIKSLHSHIFDGSLDSHSNHLKLSLIRSLNQLNATATDNSKTFKRDYSKDIRKLELDTYKRSNTRPPQAPTWAKKLIQIRKDLNWLPEVLSGSPIEHEKLWEVFAIFVSLKIINRIEPIRQCYGRANSFTGPRINLSIDTSKSIILIKKEQQTFGLSYKYYTHSDQIRTQGALNLIFENSIDKWLFIHNSNYYKTFEHLERKGLELIYVKLDVDTLNFEEVILRLRNWL